MFFLFLLLGRLYDFHEDFNTFLALDAMVDLFANLCLNNTYEIVFFTSSTNNSVL